MRKRLFVLAAVMISNQLTAQQDTTLLDEAVITANKYPGKTSLTGKVVTIITHDQLERSGGKDLSQLLAEQAGVLIAGANSNAGKDKSLFLRGARIEHTLITIDGIPIYDPSGVGSNFDLRNLSLNTIERIEILKGSQSTLYGSDAIAGVINIITKKAGTKKFNGNVGVSYGSNETIRGNAGINGTTGKLDYNLSYSIHNTKGINEANSTIYPVTDRDGFKQQHIQFSLGFKPNEKIQVRPFFRYNDSRGDIDQGAFTDELDYTYSQKSWQAGMGNQFNLGKSMLNVLYNYNSIDRLYIDDSTESRNGFDTWSTGKYRGHEHFADIYFVTPLMASLKLTAGMDFRSSQSDQLYESIGFFSFKNEYGSDSLNQNQVSIYTAINWTGKSGFNAEAGGRINFHSTYGSHGVFNFNPSYLINKKLKVFSNISSAYRTPSLYQLFSEYGNKDLKPESAISVEAGLQYYATGNKFMGRVVGFLRNVKNVHFFFTDPNTYKSKYINQDKQKDQGIEVELSYQLSNKINIKSFYNYVNGEINTKIGQKDTVYNNLLRRPRSAFSILFSAQLTKNFSASTHLQYTGKRNDAYYDNMNFMTVNTTLDSYFLWDVYAEYGFCKNRLKVFTDLRNILGSKYTEISGFNTLGFNGYAGFRFNF